MESAFLCKNYSFPLGKKTYIMGILNVTPDSFSDGGLHNTIDNALYFAQKLIEDGADIIDIGGESTRPGFTPVDEPTEMDRILPVIEAVRRRFDIPVSVDTYKSKTALEASKAGASIINDVYGSLKDDHMFQTVADTGCGYILGHNSLSGKTKGDLLAEMDSFFAEMINKAISYSVNQNRLCLDPGIGFAKTLEQNIEAIKNLERIQKFHLPILTGTSRKSIIGGILNLPIDQRVEGSVSSAVCCMAKGADFVRVHDVLFTKRAMTVADMLLRR